jgi:hypothetical protein
MGAGGMPDGLYERDVLAWSQHQADLLRRLGRGERVNDVDWTNIAEPACPHWHGEIVAFRNDANRRFAPSMSQRIDVGALHAEALEQLRATDPTIRLPADNPFALDDLLLLGRFPIPE